MSSIPGYDLESYLLWYYRVTADNQHESNYSLGIAEIIGNIERRKNLSESEFDGLVDLFEPLRMEIEERLFEFDEENYSWRDYAGYSFDFIPNDLIDKGTEYLNKND